MMKERPILFNGEMVRAILDGRKTQTRRIVKLPDPLPPISPERAAIREDGCVEWYESGFKDPMFRAGRCPCGQPGDRLWGRETWAMSGLNRVEYKAFPADEKDFRYVSSWKPSIHMPRWASRITLEITDVRVESLQDISEQDAKNEGVFIDNILAYQRKNSVAYWNIYKKEFEVLWNSLYAKRGYGWDVNPWVWVITFKRIDKV